MGALARLPVFFALEGKRAVLAGGSQAAAWKAELLSAAGAHVEVYAEDFCDEMVALAADHAAASRSTGAVGRQTILRAPLSPSAPSIMTAMPSVSATPRRAAGVPVNVIDKPAFCDFSFGAIVNRSPLVIGISTDGAAPVFAQAIRAKLEALLPKGFADWAAAAARWRGVLKTTGLSFAGRRKFWQLFTAHAVSNPDREPSECRFRPLRRRSGGPGRGG